MPLFRRRKTRVRFAVVGLGYFAQAAVLPAFRHAQKNSELTALFSGSAAKREALAKRYGVRHALDYSRYDEFLASGAVDAVYIALPNSLHRDFAVRAAAKGVHVLCEKPMALTEEDCEAMILAAAEHHVQLMVAYRLHFEEANLRAIELAESGRLGQPRFLQASFSYQARPGNIRLVRELGGGPLYDLGVYCINAARYLFRSEPTLAWAFFSGPSQPAASSGTLAGNHRFAEVEEQVAAGLCFPDGCLAQFVCSFGAADTSSYTLVGTHGVLRVDPAFDFIGERSWTLTIDGRTSHRTFKKRDQIAPELIRFSECVLDNRVPEASGLEGLADVRVIRALQRSAETGQAVRLGGFEKRTRPHLSQQLVRPAIRGPQLIDAEPPTA